MHDWFIAQAGARAIDGAIVVVDLGGPSVLNQGEVGAITGCYYTQAPNHLTWPLWNQGRQFRKLWMLPDAPVPESINPAGVLYLVDACYDELSDQFLPPSGAPSSIPALFLDRDVSARVRRAALAGSDAELSVVASSRPVRVRDVVFKLPGAGEDKLGAAPPVDDKHAV